DLQSVPTNKVNNSNNFTLKTKPNHLPAVFLYFKNTFNYNVKQYINTLSNNHQPMYYVANPRRVLKPARISLLKTKTISFLAISSKIL
ncbi:hypothetical protein, partial [Flavobacterium macrobrachii]|uniref:hypothetical protein n=1 Tax=Flavobacterium macrobrachii TaxID=591204 RepID=UPI001CA40AA0